MIEKGTHELYGQELEYVSIDLSDRRHKNRVLDFFETRDALSNAFTCKIQAKWSEGKFHPTMVMDEEEFLDFADALSKWADRIRESRDV